MDETGKTVNLNLKKGEDVVISDATIQKLKVTGELIPDNYSLEQNYPNPFNPTTTIEYSLGYDGFVRLSLYNILGEEVALLVNTQQKAGKYGINFDAKELSSGVYIYKIVTENFTLAKKLMITK